MVTDAREIVSSALVQCVETLMRERSRRELHVHQARACRHRVAASNRLCQRVHGVGGVHEWNGEVGGGILLHVLHERNTRTDQ
jgi:hypothetical protein